MLGKVDWVTAAVAVLLVLFVIPMVQRVLNRA